WYDSRATPRTDGRAACLSIGGRYRHPDRGCRSTARRRRRDPSGGVPRATAPSARTPREQRRSYDREWEAFARGVCRSECGDLKGGVPDRGRTAWRRSKAPWPDIISALPPAALAGGANCHHCCAWRLNSNPRPAMTQTTNRFFDEMARLMNDAAGVASGVRREFDTMVRNQADRILRDLDVVKREEFEADK